MRRSGTTQDELRRHNLGAVLSTVHVNGPTTRAELTARLGLNRSTIGDLAAELEAAKLVYQDQVAGTGGAGRPSVIVRPASDQAQVLGIEIAVEHLTVARVGLGGHIVSRLQRRHDRATHSLADVTEVISVMAAEVTGDAPLLGVAASVPGIVRDYDGMVRFAPNLGWIDQPLGQSLRGIFNMPVAVRNDADLGALAESRRGVASGVEDLIYLAGDVGVGGGIMAAGVPLRGAGGYAGELGHMRVNREGLDCRCGSRGCWETEIGENAILRAAGRLPGGGAEAVREVFHAARGSDTRASAATQNAAGWLGVGIGSLVNLFNPSVVILGGILGDLFQAASADVLAAIDQSSLWVDREKLHVTRPNLGENTIVLGAAELAFAGLLADPLEVATTHQVAATSF